MKPKIKHPKLDPKKNPELKQLAKLVGEFIEYWGFKSVQGRLWCYLYLIKEPLNSRQLAQLLEISPALVTQSVQILLEYKVIIEADKGPNGVLRFQANPNTSEAVASVLAGREMVLLEKVHSAQKQLEKNKKSSDAELEMNSARVKQIGQWMSLAKLFLESGLKSLKNDHNPFSDPGSFREFVDLE